MNKKKLEVIETGEFVDAVIQDELGGDQYYNEIVYLYEGSYYLINGEGTENDFFDTCVYDEDEEPKKMDEKALKFYGIMEENENEN